MTITRLCDMYDHIGFVFVVVVLMVVYVGSSLQKQLLINLPFSPSHTIPFPVRLRNSKLVAVFDVLHTLTDVPGTTHHDGRVFAHPLS